MKAIIFLLATCLAVTAMAQNDNYSSIALEKKHGSTLVNFTLKREVNARYYRIEASTNGQDYEVVATMPSKGNSVLSKTYTYDLSAYMNGYYRVGQVTMSGDVFYSAAVNKTNDVLPGNIPDVKPGNAIASQR